MAITLGLVEAVDSNGVYVSMPGTRGILRGPYQSLENVSVGDTVVIVTTDDGLAVITGTPLARGYYGTLAMDGLANLRVGDTDEYECSIRFKALRSGTIVGFRAYWFGDPPPVSPGYSAGTGGTIRITGETDSGGIPSGSVLAEVEVAGADTGLEYHAFDSPMPVTAGQTYHIVCRNVDADPAANFASLNCIWVDTVTDYQTRPDGGELAVLSTNTGANWATVSDHRPVVDLTYGDGTHQGQGYMEAEVGSTISGNSMVRERVTVGQRGRVDTSGGVREEQACGADSLLIRLEDAAGTVIDSLSVSIAAVPTLADPAGDPAGAWVSGTFSTPLQLSRGQEYRLRLSIAGTSSLWTRGIQQGEGYSFDEATYYSDGVLETSTDGGSSWGYVSGLGSWGDMQFYFI